MFPIRHGSRNNLLTTLSVSWETAFMSRNHLSLSRDTSHVPDVLGRGFIVRRSTCVGISSGHRTHRLNRHARSFFRQAFPSDLLCVCVCAMVVSLSVVCFSIVCSTLCFQELGVLVSPLIPVCMHASRVEGRPGWHDCVHPCGEYAIWVRSKLHASSVSLLR